MKYVLIFGDNKLINRRNSHSAQIGLCIKELGLETTYMMIDPILNYSTGNISPGKKGEVFVLSDGTETDLALGIFERTCGVNLTKESYVTVGKILSNMIEATKEGYYNCEVLNFDIELNKHVKNSLEIFENFKVKKEDGSKKNIDVLIVDLQKIMMDKSVYFLVESIIKFIREKDDIYILSCDLEDEGKKKESGEFLKLINLLKTEKVKKNVFSYLKCNKKNILRKIINKEEGEIVDIIKESKNSENFFTKEILNQILNNEIKILNNFKENNKNLIEKNKENIKNHEFNIFLISEFSVSSNAYCTLEDSLLFANEINNTCIKIIYFDIHINEFSDYDTISKKLNCANGIILPGGFSSDAINTRINIVRYARENNIPFLGICQGFQIGLIEFAINVLGISNATSEEFNNKTKENIICHIKNICCKNTGENIFLGEYLVTFRDRGEGMNIYSSQQVKERFRHRYAFNKLYKDKFEAKGLTFCAKSSHNCLVFFKLNKHKFFTGVQYHPELISKRNDIDPIIKHFIDAVNTTY